MNIHYTAATADDNDDSTSF